VRDPSKVLEGGLGLGTGRTGQEQWVGIQQEGSRNMCLRWKRRKAGFQNYSKSDGKGVLVDCTNLNRTDSGTEGGP
jgi:hypothetical protein